jgi:hypothetical protein
MVDLELALLALTALGLVLGSWGIVWARMSDRQWRIDAGRIVFVATLIGLGAAGSVGAMHQADALAPLGLLAGFLVIGMLWEIPQPYVGRVDVLSMAEEK